MLLACPVREKQEPTALGKALGQSIKKARQVLKQGHCQDSQELSTTAASEVQGKLREEK